MSEIYDKLYSEDVMPQQPDRQQWQASWQIGPEHDTRSLPGQPPMRKNARPVGGASLTSRIKSLFK